MLAGDRPVWIGYPVSVSLRCATSLHAYARMERRRASLLPPERARVLLGFVGEAAPAALVEAGLAFLVEGERVPIDAEIEAAVAACRPLADLLARAHDAGLARAISFAVARSAAEGAPLPDLLARLPPALPYEEQLHLAALLRIEAIAETAGAEQGLVTEAAAAAADLLAVGAPLALLTRATSALLGLSRGAAEPLRMRLFSEAVLRMFAAACDGARRAQEGAPVDDLVGTILSGGDADELQQERAAPFRRYAAQHAYLVGAIAGENPGWWPQLIEEVLERQGGEDFGPLPALLAGLGDTARAAAAPALRDALLACARSGRPTVRQTALRALVLMQDADPQALQAISAAVRDPAEAVRVQVAAALLGGGPETRWLPLLARLCDDPSPAVRAAAAWSALGRGEVPAQLVDTVTEDLETGNPATRFGAAMATACLGATEPMIGEVLAQALYEAGAEGGPEWEGLERFASAAWPLSLWASSAEGARRIYEEAAGSQTDSNGWLFALGFALRSEWRGVPPAPTELREAIRARALACLSAAEEVERVAAAMVLARHCRGDARLIDTLLGVDLPSREMLQILAILSPEVGVAHARYVPPLRGWLRAEEGPPEETELALRCLGELAPAEDEEAARLLLGRLRGASADAAYLALCRLIARR